MNKLVLVLAIALAVSIATALLYARQAHREHARADALAERVFELEPIERGGSARPEASAQVEFPTAISTPSMKADPNVSELSEPIRPKTVMDFSGTLQTRRQVQRLQTALANGTALQEYQIQALITAIDDVQREVGQAEGETQRNERLIQVAADILFESQLEVFVALLSEQTQGGRSQTYLEAER